MLEKRGKKWRVRIMFKGHLIVKSTGTGNRELAKKIERAIYDQLVSGEWFLNEEKRTLNDMIARYEIERTSKKKSGSRDNSIFRHLKSYFGEDIPLDEIDKTIFGYERWRGALTVGKKKKPIEPATIHKELTLLRAMFNLARRKWRWVKDNPVEFIDMPVVNNERVRYLSADEFVRLFRALSQEENPGWLKPMVKMFLNTGLRLSNMLDLKWSEVNLFNRTVTIKGIKMKNGEPLSLPLTEEAYQVLCELQRQPRHIEGYVFHENGERIYAVKFQRAMRKVYKAADIKDFRPAHNYRHTVASYLRMNRVDLQTIAEILGHKDTRVTLRYAHLSVDSLREPMSVLSGIGACTKIVPVDKKEGSGNSLTP